MEFTFGVYVRPRVAISFFLVLGGPLDTGSCPSVVDDRYWFLTECSVEFFLWSLLYFHGAKSEKVREKSAVNLHL